MGRTATDSILEAASTSPLTWAALLGLVAACGACSSGGGACTTDELPPTDPCYQKGCCEIINIGPDGGVTEDAGPNTTTRMCGACNG